MKDKIQLYKTLQKINAELKRRLFARKYGETLSGSYVADVQKISELKTQKEKIISELKK